MEVLDYTISSTDYEHNNRIYTNITAPQTEFCKMTITSLITVANFIVLDRNDYIIINHVKYSVQDDFSDVDTASLTEYLNSIIQNTAAPSDLAVYYDSCNRIYFQSESDSHIEINDCSYNLKLLLGLVNVQLPIASDSNIFLCPDVGLYLSTPVLYLSCNLGSNSYKNTSKSNYTSMRILMRLTNSFFAKQPIVNVNGDYTTTVRCSDLSDVRFTLVDANYQEVKLLSPMYLTVQIEAIPDPPDKHYNNPETIQTHLQMSEFAYMRDLTERGKEYTEEQLQNLFIIEQPKQQDQQQPAQQQQQQQEDSA